MNDEFWDELYKDIPLPLQPGEKTITMMMEEIGSLDRHSMDRQIAKWIVEGKLICVGERLTIGNNRAKAYKKP
jgi:hypothetical protein